MHLRDKHRRYNFCPPNSLPKTALFPPPSPLVSYSPPPSISSPPLPSVSSGNIPLQASPRPRTFSSSSFSPGPPALPGTGGRGAVTRHLLITDTKGAMVATGSTQRATPLGRRSVGKSSTPPAMLKTLSVWIRKERCAPVEGAAAIKSTKKNKKKQNKKSVPPPSHLDTAVPLSTSFFPLQTNFGIPLLLALLLMPLNCWQIFLCVCCAREF